MRMQSWTKAGILPLKVGGLPRTDMRPRRIKELSDQEMPHSGGGLTHADGLSYFAQDCIYGRDSIDLGRLSTLGGTEQFGLRTALGRRSVTTLPRTECHTARPAPATAWK